MLQGHFDSYHVLPGVVMIEAMAQASGLCTQLADQEIADFFEDSHKDSPGNANRC